jgi:hypothetical protein
MIVAVSPRWRRPIPHGRLQHPDEPLCTARSRSAWIGRSLENWGAGQRIVDVADRGAAIGHAVLHDQMVHLHVVGLGDVDDAELVAEKPRDLHLRMRR